MWRMDRERTTAQIGSERGRRITSWPPGSNQGLFAKRVTTKPLVAVEFAVLALIQTMQWYEWFLIGFKKEPWRKLVAIMVRFLYGVP